MPRFPHLRLPGKGCSGLEWAVGCLGRHITQSHSAGWGRFAAGTPQLCSQNRCFLHLPRRCLGVATPLCPSPGILRVASLCPTCLLHPRVLPACLPTPPLLCKHPPRPPRRLPALTQWHPEMTAPRCRQESPMAYPPPQRLCPSQLLPVSWDAPLKARIRHGPHGWDGAGDGGMPPVEPATRGGELYQPSPAVS